MRGQRNLRLTKLLTQMLLHPNVTQHLIDFAVDFDVSKTIISDDVVAIDTSLRELGLGYVLVDKGRNGGARFVPFLSKENREQFLSDLAKELGKSKRILPGGLIYYSDLIFQPDIAQKLAFCLASLYDDVKIDTVLTSEVKGIPVALYLAQALNAKLAVCRFRNRASDGAAMAVHYPTSNGDVRTMYMGTQQMQKGTKVLIMDDFLRGGSTITGMALMAEQFKAKVVGVATIIANKKPKLKIDKRYSSLLTFSTDEYGITKLSVTHND